jgi:hypothetical protein
MPTRTTKNQTAENLHDGEGAPHLRTEPIHQLAGGEYAQIVCATVSLGDRSANDSGSPSIDVEDLRELSVVQYRGTTRG